MCVCCPVITTSSTPRCFNRSSSPVKSKAPYTRFGETISPSRGASCGINSGWLNQLLRKRKAAPHTHDTGVEANAESLWDVLARWGWAGPRFENNITQMVAQLAEADHVAYHEGLETLGRCLGAATLRTTEAGAPDVVWSFLTGNVHIAFEAKTGKKRTGVLSKKEVQEAKGHSDWIRHRLGDDCVRDEIATIVLAPSSALHQIALPFAGGLFYVAPASVLILAKSVADNIRDLRINFSGRDFPDAAREFSAEMRNRAMTIDSIKKALLSDLLKE